MASTRRRSSVRRIVHQRAKGPVDPGLGTKVRELRLIRGLTQRELAGGDFTKGFVSLLENGRTRVSLRAAEILAQRLGVKVVDLVESSAAGNELELVLLRAEQQLAAGKTAEALELLD